MSINSRNYHHWKKAKARQRWANLSPQEQHRRSLKAAQNRAAKARSPSLDSLLPK